VSCPECNARTDHARQHRDWCSRHPDPPVVDEPEPERHRTYTIELDAYEVSNLKAFLESVGYPVRGEREFPEPNPMSAGHTGDWTGQIWWKLDALDVDRDPNVTGQEMAYDALGRVRAWDNHQLTENGERGRRVRPVRPVGEDVGGYGPEGCIPMADIRRESPVVEALVKEWKIEGERE
jgi:hypothetical protein